MTLTQFLLARIAEDEAALSRPLRGDGKRSRLEARGLRRCEVDRRIVGRHSYGGPFGNSQDDCHWSFTADSVGPDKPCPTLRALGTIYADHPDYDEAWRL